MAESKTRVLIAKPGLDGHDRGAKVVARYLRDAGFEVIYMGLRQTPDKIAATADQEDVNLVGLSILSGAHLSLTQKVRKELDSRGLDVKIMLGGTIPHSDVEELKAAGADEVFPTGSDLDDILEYVKSLAG